MAVSLFASLGVNAAADDTVVIVTAKEGDTVYSLCQSLGYGSESVIPDDFEAGKRRYLPYLF